MCYAENQLKSLWIPFQLLFLFSKCGCWGLFPPISSLSLHGCWKGDKRGNNGHTGLNSANLLHFLSETQRQFCTKVFTLSSVGLCFPWKRFLKGIFCFRFCLWIWLWPIGDEKKFKEKSEGFQNFISISGFSDILDVQKYHLWTFGKADLIGSTNLVHLFELFSSQ